MESATVEQQTSAPAAAGGELVLALGQAQEAYDPLYQLFLSASDLGRRLGILHR